MGVLMAHMSQPVPDIRSERPDLNDAIQQVISTAMARKPEGRYPTAHLLSLLRIRESDARGMGERVRVRGRDAQPGCLYDRPRSARWTPTPLPLGSL